MKPNFRSPMNWQCLLWEVFDLTCQMNKEGGFRPSGHLNAKPHDTSNYEHISSSNDSTLSRYGIQEDGGTVSPEREGFSAYPIVHLNRERLGLVRQIKSKLQISNAPIEHLVIGEGLLHVEIRVLVLNQTLATKDAA